MILVYILVIAYILAVNFYSFLLVKTNSATEYGEENEKKSLGKLFTAGALGGAITVYVCSLIFKYKRSNLLFMVLMPILGVLNVYLWVLLFRSGFSFLSF